MVGAAGQSLQAVQASPGPGQGSKEESLRSRPSDEKQSQEAHLGTILQSGQVSRAALHLRSELDAAGDRVGGSEDGAHHPGLPQEEGGSEVGNEQDGPTRQWGHEDFAMPLQRIFMRSRVSLQGCTGGIEEGGELQWHQLLHLPHVDQGYTHQTADNPGLEDALRKGRHWPLRSQIGSAGLHQSWMDYITNSLFGPMEIVGNPFLCGGGLGIYACQFGRSKQGHL